MSEFFCPPKDSVSAAADFAEVARYLGYGKKTPPDETVSKMIDRACNEMAGVITPQAVYDTFAVSLQPPDQIAFSSVTLFSKDLSRNLGGCGCGETPACPQCNQLVLLAATLGPQADALIRRQQLLDKPYAAVLQATGAMYIETVVDMLNTHIKSEANKKGLCARPRFSPGYGDVPLEVQKTFFNLLPCSRIGLTLMDSLIMAPEKSVTAFIGLYHE